MSVTKVRLFALGLAAAGVAALGLLANAADPQTPAKPADGGVRVEAPGTAVAVDKERGKVSVHAPHTDVRVDPDKGRVQVRAPYVNLDIRW